MQALIAGLPGGMEWVILLIVALLLFGGSRLAGIGKGTGRAIREFKEETEGLRSTKPVTGSTSAEVRDAQIQNAENRTEAEIQAEKRDIL